jgi:hypothetical protein
MQGVTRKGQVGTKGVQVGTGIAQVGTSGLQVGTNRPQVGTKISSFSITPMFSTRPFNVPGLGCSFCSF